MKRPVAALCALIVMCGMLWTGLRRPVSPAPGTPTGMPQADRVGRQSGSELSGASDRIESLLDVAQRGDVAAYLASFGGPLRARLERLADERGRNAFAAGLRSTAQARKSHTIFDPEPDGDAPDSARIIAESTFADRIERQTYRLVRDDSGWIITDIETARDRVPNKALGSIATFQEPEGVPVATDQTTGIPTVPADPEEN
jgi:hypothetical protein